MRTRDEVLREFGSSQCILGEKCVHQHCRAEMAMADRIRELEQEHHEDEGVIAVWRGRTERAEQRIRELEQEVFAARVDLDFANKAASEPVACPRWGTCFSHDCTCHPSAAASEPVAWVASVIEKHLGYTNGWAVSGERYLEDCQDAAREILAGMPHASAAAVRVTDAMVRSAFVRLYPGCEPDEMQHYHAADIRAALKAALDAAEGTPGA